MTDNDDYLGLASVESQTGELSGIHEKAADKHLFIKGDVLTAGYAPILIKSSSLRKVVFALLNFMLCE